MEKETFLEKVFEVVRLIPKGRVTSYGSIAAYIGAPRSARMVGWAMNKSHIELNVPAHRVVNSSGLLTGKFHFPTPDAMQKELELEGITVKNDKIVNFKTVFWNPNIEL